MSAERGDCPTVRKLIQEYKDKPEILNINCRDSLERSALISAIENENIELIKLLLEEGIEVKVRYNLELPRKNQVTLQKFKQKSLITVLSDLCINFKYELRGFFLKEPNSL